MDYIDIIKRMPKIHCARGPQRCRKCKEYQDDISFCLIRVYLEIQNEARPITEIYVGCRRIKGEYDIMKTFDSDEEAKEYAIKNNLEISFE